MLPIESHRGPVNCVSFSPDGNLLLTGSDDHTLAIWDVPSGKLLRRIFQHRGRVTACAFLPDGRQIVSAGEYGELLVSDLIVEQSRLLSNPMSSSGDVSSLSVRSNGTEVLLGTTHGWVFAVNPADGQETFRSGVMSCATTECKIWTTGYLPGGTRFAGSGLGPMRKFDDTGGSAQKIDFRAKSSVVLPDGRVIAGGEKEIIEASVEGEKNALAATGGWILGLDVTPDRKLALSADETGAASLWSVDNPNVTCSLPALGEPATVKFGKSDPSGTWFVLAGAHGVALGNTAACAHGGQVDTTVFAFERDPITSVAVGKKTLTGSRSGYVSSWHTEARRQTARDYCYRGEVSTLLAMDRGVWLSTGPGEKRQVILRNAAALASIESSPIASAINANGTSLMWASGEGRLFETNVMGDIDTVDSNQNGIQAIAANVSSDEAVAGGDNPFLLHRTVSKEGFFSWEGWQRVDSANGHVTSLAYSSHARWLAEGHANGKVLLRHADNGAIDATFEGLNDLIRGLAFTDTHLWAATATGCLARWSLTDPSKPDAPPICEHTPINGFSAANDGSSLVLALEDGTARIRALPEGNLVADLVTMQDGSWVAISPDHYEASSSRLGLFFESTNKELVRLDGTRLEPRWSGFEPISLGPTTARFRGTVFSPFGKPELFLDDRWSVKSLRESSSEPFSYDVDFVLGDDEGQDHTLDVVARGLPVVRRTIDVGFHVNKARALLIGNELYGSPTPAATGATRDVDSFADALRGKTSWGLPGERLTVLKNIGFAKMSAAVSEFFQDAPPDETLLFYFAGHGVKQQAGDGALLPVDYDRNRPDATLRASELWKTILASKAANVLLVLDACRAGAFAFPASAIPERSGNVKVGILTASDSSGAAQSNQSGGAFTQELVRIMRTANGAASTLTAGMVPSMLHDLPSTPGFYLDLKNLPIAWPSRSATVLRKEIAPQAGTSTDGVDVTISVMDLRQVDLEDKSVGVSDQDRILTMKFFFGHDTERLRIRITYNDPDPSKALRLETFENGGKAGSSRSVPVTLEKEAFRFSGEYAIVVQACNKAVGAESSERDKKDACENEPTRTYKLQL